MPKPLLNFKKGFIDIKNITYYIHTEVPVMGTVHYFTTDLSVYLMRLDCSKLYMM